MAQRRDSCPGSEVAGVLSFFQHVKDRLASDPPIYHKFLRILADLHTGKSPDPAKAAADARAFLRGYPDLVHRFDALFAEPARQDPAPIDAVAK